jgi:hypothetical protein
VSTLLSGRALSAIGISRSRDGVAWSAPVFAVHIPFATISFDKEWIACDNASTSRFFGSCYLAYTERNLFTPRLAFQSSRDGGLTWSEPTAATSAFGSGVVGALPVVAPDGTLTIVFDAGDTGLYAVRSTDGGTTFAPPVSIASRAHAVQPFLRAPQLPAVAVDASGRLYVTWADCVFVAGCARNSVVVATSADGSTWSPPVRVPASGLDSFAPGIAAHPSIPGRVSVVTYVPSSGAYGVAVTSSRDGGATWTRPQRLDAVSPRYTWLAASEGGRFVGDYLGATYAGGRFVPVFTLAQPPQGGRFHEYTMAASLP